MAPQMIPTPESSSVHEVGYDAQSEELYVTYVNSRAYVYRSVPSVVWDELLAAPSKGQYVNANIKGAYDYYEL